MLKTPWYAAFKPGRGFDIADLGHCSLLLGCGGTAKL